MSLTPISGGLSPSANHRCEYCLLSEANSFALHQIDHIISSKHGGSSVESNLALACVRCNAWKGSDIASFDPLTGDLVALFHPRRQDCQDHFRLDGPSIEPLPPAGRATAKLRSTLPSALPSGG